nr:hypothetical protein CFP56_36449 [Quercus suber]
MGSRRDRILGLDDRECQAGNVGGETTKSTFLGRGGAGQARAKTIRRRRVRFAGSISGGGGGGGGGGHVSWRRTGHVSGWVAVLRGGVAWCRGRAKKIKKGETEEKKKRQQSESKARQPQRDARSVAWSLAVSAWTVQGRSDRGIVCICDDDPGGGGDDHDHAAAEGSFDILLWRRYSCWQGMTLSALLRSTAIRHVYPGHGLGPVLWKGTLAYGLGWPAERWHEFRLLSCNDRRSAR